MPKASVATSSAQSLKQQLVASFAALPSPAVATEDQALSPAAAPFEPPLTPAQLSELLKREFNINRSVRRLQHLRMSGRGPPYYRSGATEVRYPPTPARQWARAELGQLVTSTAAETARKQAATSDPD